MGHWFCDSASIYNRWALQQCWKSPGIPTKNNAELSASILHPGTVFIWITPPNPLSNDMTQWVTIPQTLLREKHWIFGRERLECGAKSSLKMNSSGTEYWNAYSTSVYREHIWLRENYLDILINCQGLFQQQSQQILIKLNYCISAQMCHAHQTLTTPGWNLPWTRQRA